MYILRINPIFLEEEERMEYFALGSLRPWVVSTGDTERHTVFAHH